MSYVPHTFLVWPDGMTVPDTVIAFQRVDLDAEVERAKAEYEREREAHLRALDICDALCALDTTRPS